MPDGLMRPLVLYSMHPLVELGLRRSQVCEHPVGAELGPHAPMEPLDLPRRGRRPRLGQPVRRSPFSRQIRSNSTSTGGWLNRPVNTLPLSVRISPGTPQRAHRQRQPITHPLRRLPHHQERRHAEPGVIIDPGQRLGLVPSASTNPPTTSICHNSIGEPRSHRFHFRSRGRRASGSISPNRTNARYTPDSDGNGSTPAGQLEHQPPRTPRRMRPPQLAPPPPPHPPTSDADTTAADATDPPASRAHRPRTSRSHACNVFRDTPNRAATSVTVSPSAITASTA